MKNVPRTQDGKVDLNAPPRRTPDGKIDLSGFWLPTNPVKHLLNLAADLKPGERAAAAVGRSRLQGAHREQRQGSSWRALLAVGHPREAEHPRRPEAGADAGRDALPARVAHHLSPGVHRRTQASACPRTRSRRGWDIRSAAGKATRSSSRRSARTARRGSTCAVCPAPRRCGSIERYTPADDRPHLHRRDHRRLRRPTRSRGTSGSPGTSSPTGS